MMVSGTKRPPYLPNRPCASGMVTGCALCSALSLTWVMLLRPPPPAATPIPNRRRAPHSPILGEGGLAFPLVPLLKSFARRFRGGTLLQTDNLVLDYTLSKRILAGRDVML